MEVWGGENCIVPKQFDGTIDIRRLCRYAPHEINYKCNTVKKYTPY